MSRDGLPRAYLRMDPNIDQTHPDPGTFIRLMCVAHRQPDRGRFRELVILERAFGKVKVRAMIARRDLEELPDGRWYLVGWDEWQEGDFDVATRMRRLRQRRKDAGVVPPKTGRERTADWRLKGEILERDGHTCRYCGAYEYPRELLVAEHVIPHPTGPTTSDNLVTACAPCNVRKGGRTPEEAGMTLHEIGYRSTLDPLGDTPRVTRPVTRHDDTERVTVTTDAGTTTEEGLQGVGVGVGDSPPPPVGRRKDGTNPRSLGTNPRANGTSPRQERQRQKTGPTALHEILRKAAAAGSEA